MTTSLGPGPPPRSNGKILTATSRVRRRVLLTLGAVAVVAGVVVTLTWTGVLWGGDTQARSVILISGDGMAAAQREAARLDQEGPDGRLAMDSLPVAGRQSTDPADPGEGVTDSAAAATAWATGQRTYNGAISVDVDGDPLPTLGAEAKESGRATGLVTTAAVTDASPAAFFSNVTDRDEQGDIADQYVEVTRPDVILGGGQNVWQSGDRPTPAARAEEEGYTYVTDADELAAADGDRLLGLFAGEEMYRSTADAQDSEYDPMVTLADMTAKALAALSPDEQGFFLFVEEEAVDSAGHDNNGELMLEAMRALDAAVEVARAYVAEHPDTLLIVTGDHETGGLTVEDWGGGDGMASEDDAGDGQSRDENGPFDVANSDRKFVLDWSTGDHTKDPTPVSAEGPGSEQLAGSYPNTHLHEVMREILVD